MKNLPIKHLQYAKSYAFFIWICESINGLTFKVSMFEKSGEYLKNLATKNLYKILEIAFFGLFDIVEYFQRANLASEQHCPIVVNTYISPPLPLTLSRFLDLCSLDPVYRIYFSIHCAHGLVVHTEYE